jgi:hypothetical protein
MSEQGTVHKPAPKNSTIPVKLLHDPQAKDGTIRLYAHMYWRYGQNKRNFEGQKSMAGYLRVTPATIGKRAKELEFLDWLVVVEKDYNPTTGNYTTPHYHLFLSQSDCRKFRDEYVPQDGEHIRPKPSADEVELRKSRKGAGRKGGNPEVYRANSGLDGLPNSGLDGLPNSGLDELNPSYPTEVTNVTSSKTLAPGVAVAVSTELDDKAATADVCPHCGDTTIVSGTVPCCMWCGKPLQIDATERIDTPINTQPPGPDPMPVPLPEEKKPRNEWYDVIAETFKAEGWRNGKIANILRGTAKGNEAKFNIDQPLTDPAQVRVFWTWYQKVCEGCSLVDSAAVQDYVMRWQKELAAPKQLTPAPIDMNDGIVWMLPEDYLK